MEISPKILNFSEFSAFFILLINRAEGKNYLIISDIYRIFEQYVEVLTLTNYQNKIIFMLEDNLVEEHKC